MISPGTKWAIAWWRLSPGEKFLVLWTAMTVFAYAEEYFLGSLT